MYDYWPCNVLDVHDADTIKFDVDMGLDIHRHIWVRLNGVWSPELGEPYGAEYAIAVGKRVTGQQWRIRTFKVGLTDKERMTFVRYVADVESLDGLFSLNRWIVESGYGKAIK